MATHDMSEVVQHLRRAMLRRECAGMTDGQLLECFVSRQESAALEALVQRHAPMVWNVCRRVLCRYHDAEDAFQATFLVLARKAASIMPREMVVNWLYGVAYQTALKARATTAKQRGRERQVTAMPEPEAMPQELRWSDLQVLLDQELSRLPDKYRLAIVLCDLEGKTRKEAAEQLGLPEGTVASRLMRARTMLAKRLGRHGLAVSSASLAAVLAQNAASACVPAAVLSSTLKAVGMVAAGQAAAGVVSAQVAALMDGVLKTLLLAKLKTVTAALVVLGMVAFGGGLLTHHTTAGQQGTAAEVQTVRETASVAEKPRGEQESKALRNDPQQRPAQSKPAALPLPTLKKIEKVMNVKPLARPPGGPLPSDAPHE